MDLIERKLKNECVGGMEQGMSRIEKDRVELVDERECVDGLKE
jgi:hypothetical protein